MGKPPHWYLLIRAAKYLGVPPWDLEQAPIEWFYRALAAEEAEAKAEADHVKRLRSRRGRS